MGPDTTNGNNFDVPPALAELSAAVPTEAAAPDAPKQTAVSNNAAAIQQIASSVTAATPTAQPDDTVVDKEWVLKAKQIVNQTAGDPFQQNNQLAAVKAEYLQKRYGKTVKVVE